jgi:hypothetical protein
MIGEVRAAPRCVNTLGNKFLRLSEDARDRDLPLSGVCAAKTHSLPSKIFTWQESRRYRPLAGTAGAWADGSPHDTKAN